MFLRWINVFAANLSFNSKAHVMPDIVTFKYQVVSYNNTSKRHLQPAHVSSRSLKNSAGFHLAGA
jgi:hypothetical protein